jgi:hypothetical protein
VNAERGGVYPPFVDFIACHFPPLSFLYWIAGWRSSGHDLADVVAIHVIGVIYVLFRIQRLLPPGRRTSWTAGLLLAAPVMLPLVYWVDLKKLRR